MTRKYIKQNHWLYAVYKGDEYLFEGTKEEVMKKLGIKHSTFQFYRTHYYKKNRVKNSSKRTIIIRTDGEDKIWG